MAEMTGMMVGRQVDSWRGAQKAIAPSIWMLPCFVLQALSFVPSSSGLSSSFTPARKIDISRYDDDINICKDGWHQNPLENIPINLLEGLPRPALHKSHL